MSVRTREADLPPPAGGSPRKDDYADVAALFVRLAAAADDQERQRWRCRIITRCLPLADHIAYRFVGRGEPAEDLVQVARLGLVKAVDRYDAGKGSFVGFAVPTVIGDMRRYFRDNTWGMHVPRTLKDTHRRVRAIIDPLAQRLGRTPTTGELAAELGVGCDEVQQSMEAAAAYRPVSLDAAVSGDADHEWSVAGRQGGIDPHYGDVEDALVVAKLVSRLTDRERAILAMRFGECWPQSRIAQQLGISQVQVSRLLTITLERLRRSAGA